MNLVEQTHDKILELIGNIKNGEIPELEVRIKNVQRVKFIYLLETLKGMYDYETTISTDHFVDGSRHSIISPKNDGDPFIHQIIVKNKIYNKDDENYDVRLALASEIPSKDEELENDTYKSQPRSHIRSKQRTSFTFKDVARVDLTQVVSTSHKKNEVTYEVEVELVGDFTRENFKIMDETVYDMLKILQGSKYVYTKDMKNQIVDDYNSILKAEFDRYSYKNPKLSHTVLSQARNLDFKDCVFGAIVGGKYSYSITNKARGNRRQLMIHSSGVWLLFPPYDFNLVIKKNMNNANFLDSFDGTILDGEDIPLKHRNDKNIKVEHYFLPFDLMSFQGEISQGDHFFRMEIVPSLTKIFSGADKVLKLKEKEFREIKSYENLSSSIHHFESSSFEYENDGYIITPINAPYKNFYLNENGKPVPVYKRTLDVYPEICKLKPWEELTIDFEYEKIGNFKALKVSNSAYKGSKFNPFDQNINIQWEHQMFNDLPSGSIIECAPTRTMNGIVMVPIMIRHNKTYPNTKEIADLVWDEIQNPLTVDMLTNKKFNLVFKYHNKEKRKLLNTIEKGATVVEIGAGRGGDLSKLKNASHILAIDPNEDNLKEYKRRQLGSGMNKNVTFLNVGGQDSDQIINAAYSSFGWKSKPTKPLYIIMMLSLSFFFGPDRLIDRLRDTIQGLVHTYVNAGGNKPVKFLFMTIEGGNVVKTFNGAGSLQLGPVQMILTGKDLYIDIPDTIVSKQNEYLVDLKELKSVVGLKDLKYRKADKERFLSDDEITYSKLYVVGSATIVKDDSFTLSKQEVNSEEIAIYKDENGGTYVYNVIEERTFFKACEFSSKRSNLRFNFSNWLKENFFTVMGGEYDRMFKEVYKIDGREYMESILSSSIHVPIEILQPLVYYIECNIIIYEYVNESLVEFVRLEYGNNSNIMIFKHEDMYFPLGYFNGVQTYYLIES